MKRLALIISIFIAVIISGGGAASVSWAGSAKYSLIAWNDLGMHCIDHDYSVFAILPPFNNLHAQLIDKRTGALVSQGVTISYMATKDTHHSINTTSVGKTNFWDFAGPLFGATLPPDVGLTGNPTPGKKPAPMTYDAVNKCWTATGIPIVPYDDKGKTNYYPMVQVVARDSGGHVLATTKTVLPVSDELACNHCHTSGTGDPAAQPSPDWVYDSDPNKDWKRNILLLHDNKNLANPLYATALAANGYSASGLLATSDSGHPILCAVCHPSNALGTAGVAGVKQLTTSMHSWHAVKAMDDNTGMPLGDTMNRTGCYYCHPGSTTQCLRGVMGIAKNPDGSLKLECQSCHGSMGKVGSDGRAGWVDVPKCQNCHYLSNGSYCRDTSGLDQSGNFRHTTSIFSTRSGLYKIVSDHGNMQCEACHGSTHAEYATSEPNDNVQSIALQKYAGVVAECTVCHPKDMPASMGGPHGMHTIGQAFVDAHGNDALLNLDGCTVCHGKDYKGTALSRAFTARKFKSEKTKVRYVKGQTVGCYDCHNGPGGPGGN